MSKIDDVRNYTYRQIQFLIRQKETSVGKAMLANLRRGIGKTPGELPELWGAFLNEMPSELYGNSGMPSEGEWAVYIALTLFALHQQGNAEPVHCEKVSLGTAAARLMNEKTEEERGRILRRFGPVVTAKSMQELSHHLRGLIHSCISISFSEVHPSHIDSAVLRWLISHSWNLSLSRELQSEKARSRHSIFFIPVKSSIFSFVHP